MLEARIMQALVPGSVAAGDSPAGCIVYLENGVPIPSAALVLEIELFAFFSCPVIARIASIVSGITIA
jgi:hypothetical protein